jgi:arylsulfatase
MLQFLLALISFFSNVEQSINKSPDPENSPNFIILFADDMGYGDLGCFGHPTIKTPNLDKMATEGTKFTNFYSASPACTASRYALLTGKYASRSGFDWVLYPKSKLGIHPAETTIAEALKSKGYATACYGKWHLGSTRDAYLPNQNGFDDYLGLPYSNDMIPPKWQPIALLDNRDTAALDPDQTLLTKMYTQRATQFITSHKDDPFFIYVPYAMPHVPLHPGKEFAGKSERGLYGDVIEEIDWSVGEIMKTLKKEGLAEHTLVIFTSDNGPWIIKDVLGGSAGLLRDGKGSTWEGGMREPMIAWWPGTVQPGAVQMQPCGTIDLFPTLLSLANTTATPIQSINGVDISKVITENETLRERPLFYYKGNELHGVRKGSWKLLIQTYSQTGKDYFEGKLPLLFNLDTDPSEKYDLSDDNPDIVKALTMELREHQRKQELQSDLHTLTPLN